MWRIYMLDDSRVWVNDALWKLWSWCVREAKYTDESSWITVNTGRGETEVEIKKGQFIFGRHSAAKILRIPESTLWKRLKKLQKLGYLNIKSNRHFSIITVIEPDEARQSIKKRNSESNSPRTTQEQPSDTSKEVKEVENVKKEIKDIFNFWNSQKIIQHRNIEGFVPEINARLKDYSPEEIKEAIKNYAEILNSDDYIWSYRWSLKDFLGRKKDNIARFLNTSKPFESCPKKIKEPDPFDRSDLEED